MSTAALLGAMLATGGPIAKKRGETRAELTPAKKRALNPAGLLPTGHHAGRVFSPSRPPRGWRATQSRARHAEKMRRQRRNAR